MLREGYYKTVEKLPEHLRDKRDELIFALSIQDYSEAQIAGIFNLHRSTIMRILRRMPEGWVPKWIKNTNNN